MVTTDSKVNKAQRLCDNIMNLTAEFNPNHGFWIKTDICTYRCPVCGKTQPSDDISELNFCCNCGSRPGLATDEYLLYFYTTYMEKTK